ncbi:MAG: hypothetical protein L3J29_13215 [Cyclobacteriaceae bacterium]|nr:hypothetical protein [Cyclobacteriaceae bacterium]
MKRLRFNFLIPVLFAAVTNITASTHSWAQAPVVWTDFVNTTISGTTLLKTAAFGWNAGAASVAKLGVGENGWVEYKVEEIGEKMLGLSSVNLNEDFTTIEYGLFSYYSTIKIIENGITKVSNLTYNVGDTLRIERLNNVIYYKRNGSIIYTSTQASTSELLVDVSLKRPTAKMSDVYFKKSINGDVNDHTEYQALKALYESTDGANWTNNTGWPTAGNCNGR